MLKQPNLSDTGQLLNLCHDMIAYFSMEIGFRNEIPTYSGGLGILAGDTLKAMADLNVEVVAITLLSEKGYFYQTFKDDWQQEQDYKWNVDSLLRKLDVEVSIKIGNRDVYVNAWQYDLKGVRGHNLRIYFLDTNNEKNSKEDRLLTSHLYGGDLLYRLRQEIVLGVAGVKILRALGHYPKKYHMNEGHAAFLILELYNELHGVKSEEDKKLVLRTLCSFTTHTPVPAGHDSFEKHMVMDALNGNLPRSLLESSCEGDKFSMTRFALEYSSYVNSVARKHQEVSKQMFPNYSIDYITNGIHTLTWANKHHASLFDKYIIDWRVNPLELRTAHRIPLREILVSHQKAKQELIDFINTTENAGFEYDIFTIGFARRATAYKRAELLFQNVQRLKEISRKVGRIQLVFAGKAHPRDGNGKEIIRRLRQMAIQLAPTIKMVFVENYNMYTGKLLTSGVDLWLNTPKRPLEASGTSGMKAAANGVPSLSVPDGWWIEGLIEGVTGWGIGGEIVSGMSDQEIDAADAKSLYDKLEFDIVPLFYNNPDGYALVMRNSIAINGSYFNTHRMVKQYIVRAYTRNN